jgi:stage II sporulation protein D
MAPPLLLALAASVALVLAAAPAAEAGSTFVLKGRGYGHGVGMSQWGAYGFAKKGRSYRQILGHYFSGTKISRTKTRSVGVLLGAEPNSVFFKGAKRACGRDLKPSKKYVAVLRGGNKIRLETHRGKKMASCGKKLGARGTGTIRIENQGIYRGNLVALPAGGDLNVINRVGIEDYLRGVVPYEMPASWADDALRAQAVAARSYALASGIKGDGFSLYDDTRSQVYGGVVAEEAATTKAVAKTKAQVVTYKGKVAQTFFYSSSGGRTESSRFGFGGGESRPYLKAVDDPFDDISPYHSWTERMSRAELQSKLGDWVDGRLRGVKVVETGDSPRIVRARVIGTRGKTAVSGFDLQGRLGLRSTWVRFKKR